MEPEAPQTEPEVPKKRGRKPKAAQPPVAQVMTAADVMALIPQIIAEARKPSELEQAKIDKERAGELARAKARAEGAKAVEKARRTLMMGCQHAAYNPATKVWSHTWRCSTNSPDGEKPYGIPICLRCNTQLPKIYASTQQLTEGWNFDKYPSLDMDSLVKWAVTSGNKEAENFKLAMGA